MERSARARAGVREAQGAADDAGRRLKRAERELAEAEAAAERISERTSEQRARLQTVIGESSAGAAERTRLTQDLANRQSVLRDLESAQEAARERRVHWQVEEVQVTAREQSAIERESRARSALAEATSRIRQLTSELTEIEESTQQLTERRRSWDEDLAERRTAVEEMESAAATADTDVTAAEQALDDATDAVQRAREHLEGVNEDLHQAELRLTEEEGHRQALIERVEAEWHKPLDRLLNEAPEVEGDIEVLRAEAERLQTELERIGPVNPLAVEEHTEELNRLEFLQGQRDDLVSARDSLHQALREIEVTAREMFLETFGAVRENFHSVFTTLFDGGECDVRLADEGSPLESDILIQAAPRGKRTQRIHLLSSGERALVAISLLFAIYLTKPAPFCLLDEVDAPLDDANVMRFVRLLDEFKADTQFIVITHNPRTMQVADSVYGVTMQEPGVSTIVGVRLGDVEPTVA
jgi:chromosome segregation protein